MSEKKAIRYFEKLGRRVLVDLKLYEDDLLVDEFKQLAVAHMVGRDGMLAWRSLEGPPTVLRVADAKKSGDDLAVFGRTGPFDIEMTLTPPWLGPTMDKFFERRDGTDEEHIAFLNSRIDDTLTDKQMMVTRKAKKKFKVVEVGVISYESGVLETAGVIAASGRDARFVPSLKYRDILYSYFEEKIIAVEAHRQANPGTTSYSKWLDYLALSGGQGEFSFSSVHEVSGATAKEAATKRLVRALRGTGFARD